MEKERVHSSSICDKWFSSMDGNSSSVDESSTVEMNTEEGCVDSAISVITDDDLHREVRRRERSAAIRARRSPD